jgi:hypothetical protein
MKDWAKFVSLEGGPSEGCVTTRIILFSDEAKTVPLLAVHTNFPPVLVALFLGAVVTLNGPRRARP